MPRKPRKKSGNGIYHVMLRGINRQTIFEDEEDRIRLLETLKRYKSISQVEIYGYCLMDNHIHLLIKEKEETISKFIQRAGASYVYWYNNKYERCGPLFQGRFKSETVKDFPSFLRVLRYIHQNPLKAGLEKNMLEYQWTSMNEYIGHPILVDVEAGLHLFSPDKRKAIPLFIDYMNILNNDLYLDDDEKMKMPDSEVKSYLANLGFLDGTKLQQLEKEKRNEMLLEMKQLEVL